MYVCDEEELLTFLGGRNGVRLSPMQSLFMNPEMFCQAEA